MFNLPNLSFEKERGCPKERIKRLRIEYLKLLAERDSKERIQNEGIRTFWIPSLKEK